ncbi:N-methyl-L-tryptophan oxidase [Brevibacterium sp.]|uniref:N-methyl-L-tryptophan oxidase n=1 Tax=Brevibacterium sp. TaxID=1701 RepID=UPI0025C1B6E1|nr:N-methyl-L-tryptophan oxidase [Brevibacterium sp.]
MSSRFAVIGAGTMGAQAAWRLASRGHRVVAFEKYAPGHPYGAAGGETRLYRNIELEDLRYTPLVRRASELWLSLEAQSGWKLRDITGAVIAGHAEAEETRRALAAAEAEPGAEVLDVHDARRRFPAHAFDAEDAVIFDRGGGVIRPELTVKAAATQAVQAGCELRTHTPVTSVEDRGSHVEVTSARGAEAFDRVVVTAGAWTQHVVPQLSGQLRSHQLMSAWFAGKTANALEGVHPLIRTNPTYCYALPTSDGYGVKLGLGFGFHPRVERPEDGPRVVEEEAMAAFRERVRRYLPVVDPEPYRTDFYYESYTASRHEWLAPAPGQPNIIVASGFSGHGFKMSPAIGELAAELALGDRPSVDISFLETANDGVSW